MTYLRAIKRLELADHWRDLTGEEPPEEWDDLTLETAIREWGEDL